MFTLLKVILESSRQAFQSLRGNKMRSFLSLLGICIGIFCIIGVLSAVDSLEDYVRSSFDRLGSDVVYIQKFSWEEDPGHNYWKWMKRPNPDYSEYTALKKRLKSAQDVAYYIPVGSKTAKYRSSSVEGGFMIAGTQSMGNVLNLEMEKGRFFTPTEAATAKQKVVIGGTIAEELFGALEPVGKKIKVSGNKMEVIGVITKSEGLGIMNFDEALVISYEFGKKFINVKSRFSNMSALAVKAADGVPLSEVKSEAEGILRAHRRLKPREDSNFATNELSTFSKLLDGFFGVLNIAGGIIGIFSLIVGMFSVANIMFVSVKERTNLIGVKKALGAKRYVILLEFLIESIILCVIGGIIGMILIFFSLKAIGSALDFDLYIDAGNTAIGLTVSIFVGVIAGVIPALQAGGILVLWLASHNTTTPKYHNTNSFHERLYFNRLY